MPNTHTNQETTAEIWFLADHFWPLMKILQQQQQQNVTI